MLSPRTGSRTPLRALALTLVLGNVGSATTQPRSSPHDGTPPATAEPARPDFDPGQETPAPPATPSRVPDFDDPDAARAGRFLFDDLLGLHGTSPDQALTFYTSFTQFEQGVAAGGVGQAARWGGKFDMLASVDTGPLGLWEGGTLDLFAESRLGNSVDSFAGTYSPPNLAMYFPVPDQQITTISALSFTQAITDRSGIFFGRLNVLNGDRERFLKYPMTARFWNAAFNFNLADDRYPYTAPGAGFYIAPESGPAVSFLVLDSYNSPRTSGLERLGRNGVFLYAEAKQPTRFFDRPGSQLAAFFYGTGSFTDLSEPVFINLPDDPAAAGPLKAGTWAALWSFDQRLWSDPGNPERGLGLYVQTGIGDDNPNPVRWFASVALVGNAPWPSRHGDTYGLGYYGLGISDPLKQKLPGLRDEHGVELFYNLRIRPGCHLTPDLQILHPGLAPVDAAVVLGLRLKLDF